MNRFCESFSPVNLFCTGAVTSQLSVRQGWKIGAEGAKAVDITVDDMFSHSYAQLGALPWSTSVAIILLVNQNSGESNELKVRGKNWNTGLFTIGFDIKKEAKPLW